MASAMAQMESASMGSSEKLGVEEGLDDGRVDPLDGAVDFMDDVYLHGRLDSSNDSSGIYSLGLFYQ